MYSGFFLNILIYFFFLSLNILFLWEDFESIFSFLGCWNFSFLFNIIIIIIIYTIKFNLSILHRRNDRCHLLLSSIPNYNHASAVHLILQRIKIFDSRFERKLEKRERKDTIPPLSSHGISVDRKGNRISRGGERSSMNSRVSPA